jgi:hypothetical protein
MKRIGEGGVRDRKDLVKVEIPRALNMQIIKIMSRKDMDFIDACLELVRTHPGSEKYDEEVKKEADLLAKSRFMSQLNNTRNKIAREAFAKGVEDTRTNETNINIECQERGCSVKRHMSSNDPDYPSVIEPLLLDTFKDFYHTELHDPPEVRRRNWDTEMRKLEEDFDRYVGSSEPPQ